MKIIPRIVFILILGSSLYAARFHTTDFEYLGAFRLPDTPGPPWDINWEWSNLSSALTFYPKGDSSGTEDGYPGSLFGIGHDHTQYVSEINIPVPIISATKNVNDLNTAQTLQPFQDIKDNLYGYLEQPRVGLTYLPKQGNQTIDKLYFAWAQHLDEWATHPTHGWCDLDMSNPNSQGLWGIGDYWNYVTGDYLFEIPKTWADTNVSEKYLATGRYRDGGQGSLGPSLFAIAPWEHGNPPDTSSTIPAQPLLLYGSVYENDTYQMNNYHHSDQWAGAVWLNADNRSAVTFVGTKGQGNCWYGFSDGTVVPNPENLEGPGERGWWSDTFVAQIILYDTEELAKVANGTLQPWEPQPYATIDIDEYLYHIDSTQQWYHVGGAAYDSDNGILYVMEPLADGDKSIVHVWSISQETGVRQNQQTDMDFHLYQNYPNPFNHTTIIGYQISSFNSVKINIINELGQQIKTIFQGDLGPGYYETSWDGMNSSNAPVSSGVYFFRIQAGSLIRQKKLLFIQ